jgi:O-antigen/teichoic acid export membrane protein
MSRTRKFLYNSITTAIQQIAIMIAGFIVPYAMLVSYGSEINGLTSSITQFISYFLIVEAGLANAAVYVLYKPLAENDHKQINSIVSAAKRYYLISGYIFSLLTFGLAILYPMFIKTPELKSFEVSILVLAIGGIGALDFFTMAKYRVLLTADQRTYVISITTIIFIIINTAIIFVLAHYKINIVLLRVISLSSIFLRSFILYYYVKKRYEYIDYNELPNNTALNKRWDALYLQVLGSIQIGTPVVLATIFTSLKMVSVYTIFNMVIGGVNGVLSIFITGLPASFGDIITRKEQITLQRAYKEFEFLYYSLICIVYSVTMVTIMPFIRIFTKGITDINYNLPFIGFLFVLNGLLYNIKTPQGMLVLSAGLFKETRVQTTIQGVIAILVAIILAPSLGLSGILIGSILSNLYRDIDFLFFVPRNITKLEVRDSIYRMFRVFVTACIIYIPTIYINLHIDSYMKWFVYALTVCMISSLLVFIVGIIFDRKEIIHIYNRVLTVRRKTI